jgi:hypothetical protein
MIICAEWRRLSLIPEFAALVVYTWQEYATITQTESKTSNKWLMTH